MQAPARRDRSNGGPDERSHQVVSTTTVAGGVTGAPHCAPVRANPLCAPYKSGAGRFPAPVPAPTYGILYTAACRRSAARAAAATTPAAGSAVATAETPLRVLRDDRSMVPTMIGRDQSLPAEFRTIHRRWERILHMRGGSWIPLCTRMIQRAMSISAVVCTSDAGGYALRRYRPMFSANGARVALRLGVPYRRQLRLSGIARATSSTAPATRRSARTRAGGRRPTRTTRSTA